MCLQTPRACCGFCRKEARCGKIRLRFFFWFGTRPLMICAEGTFAHEMISGWHAVTYSDLIYRGLDLAGRFGLLFFPLFASPRVHCV